MSPWGFPSLNPLTHVDPQNFYKRIDQPALDKSGIDEVIWHTLRHTCASRLVMVGVDIRTVQEIMDHKTLTMAMRYFHLSGDHLNRGVNKISRGHSGTNGQQNGQAGKCPSGRSHLSACRYWSGIWDSNPRPSAWEAENIH